MRIASFVVFLALLAPLAALAAPTVTARIEGHMLTLTFPPHTLHHTVWLQLNGRDLPRRLSRGRSGAVHWENDTDLSVNLHLAKRAIDLRWASTAQVWGQTREGDSLLQTVTLPDHKAAH